MLIFMQLSGKVPHVPVTQVCWAHVLATAHAQFASPEEWHYSFVNQVNLSVRIDLFFSFLK